MNGLLISDLHLTVNPRDEYRWKLFDWLIHTAPQYQVKDLFILGDLTEAKDYHSAKLVNRIVSSLLRVYRQSDLLKIHLLFGNHDGLDANNPFFRFLGQYPCMHYVETPFMWPTLGLNILMLPHTRQAEEDWKLVDLEDADLILMHATFAGAVSEHGQPLGGIPLTALKRARKAVVYSGDVHVPQKIGKVTYVGAPYPVRFGDSYQGRAILLEKMRNPVFLPIPSIQRLTVVIDAVSNKITVPEVHEGDQVKFRVHMRPQDYVDWNLIKKRVIDLCEEHKLELCGLELERKKMPMPRLKGTVTPGPATAEQIFSDYCTREKLDADKANIGREILSRLP